MSTSTFAHPYTIQLLSLWLSFLPAAGVAVLIIAAALRGDRGFAQPRRQVPVLAVHRQQASTR